MEAFQCKRYISHKSFRPVAHFSPYVIALIRLRQHKDLNTRQKTAFDFNKPGHGALKPCPPSMRNSEGIALGLGMIQQNPPLYPYVLMQSKLKRYFECGTLSQTHGMTIKGDAQVCYGDETDYPAVMTKSDAGNPLVALSSTGEPSCLIGVSSFGHHAFTNPKFPSVSTRVDTLQAWIRTEIIAIHRNL